KDRLDKLEPTVRRAMQEARERQRRKRAETELVRREKYFRTLTENSLDVLTILSHEGLFQYASPSAKRVLGYEPQELIGRSPFDRTAVSPDLRLQSGPDVGFGSRNARLPRSERSRAPALRLHAHGISRPDPERHSAARGSRPAEQLSHRCRARSSKPRRHR